MRKWFLSHVSPPALVHATVREHVKKATFHKKNRRKKGLGVGGDSEHLHSDCPPSPKRKFTSFEEIGYRDVGVHGYEVVRFRRIRRAALLGPRCRVNPVHDSAWVFPPDVTFRNACG